MSTGYARAIRRVMCSGPMAPSETRVAFSRTVAAGLCRHDRPARHRASKVTPAKEAARRRRNETIPEPDHGISIVQDHAQPESLACGRRQLP